MAGALSLPRLAKDIGAGVPGIVEDANNLMMFQGTKHNLVPDKAVGKKNALGGEVLHDALCRTRSAEGLEEEAHRVLDLSVRIEGELLAVMDKTDGRAHPELTPSGFVEHPA
jgi:hypothetical protein